MTPAPVAIIGAGIAGLTAALGLARHGIASVILERAAALEEVGAGLQLSPNATRRLETLGLTPALRPHWLEPEAIRLVDGRSGRRLAEVPAGPFAARRWGAPYAVLHRAALQSVLIDAVRSSPLCRLRLDTPVETLSSLTTLLGEEPQLIIGADGVHSVARAQVSGAGAKRFSGSLAWRWTLYDDRASAFDPTAVTAYLSPGAHLVAYPLGQGRGVNLVAIAQGSARTAPDSTPPEARFKDWQPALRAALPRPGEARLWPLHEVEDGAWLDGRVLLIGDAAHAMTPFAAQGAAMAIEDGVDLADAFAAGGLAGLPAVLAARRERVARVKARGAFNRFAYHAGGPFRLGRDIVLSLRPPERLAADLDWLYGEG